MRCYLLGLPASLKVLVMEFVHGIPLADFIQNDAKEEDKRAVATLGSEWALKTR